MRHRGLARASLTSLSVLIVLIADQGCSLFSAEDAVTDGRLCTPGSYVFCRCADRSEGTKLCRADGASFEACRSSETASCDEISAAAKSSSDAATKFAAATPSTDACPGEAAKVSQGRTITLVGDTTTATADRHGQSSTCATGAGSQDHIYHLLPSASGALDVELRGEGALAPLAYLRTTCDDAASEVGCAATSLRVDVRANRDYFLVIDGADGSAGAYTALVTLSPHAFCGDGNVDPGEACDDGNELDGDGCNDECTRVDGDPSAAAGCDGQPVAVWPDHPVSGMGRAAPYTGGHLYAVTAHAAGNLIAGVDASPGATIVARTSCVGAAASTVGAVLDVSVTDGEKVWIAVETPNQTPNEAEDYTITFTLH
jgi:cysteine-rich repeat protein